MTEQTITAQDIATAEQQAGAKTAAQPKPKRVQNHKLRTSLKRLAYMREYNKRCKMARMADEYGYIKVREGATPKELRDAAMQAVTVSAKDGLDRSTLLRKFEALAHSGNDMAAIAALKAYAEFAGIGPNQREEGQLTPDQAHSYHARLMQATQSRLANSGAVLVEVITAGDHERLEGSPDSVLERITAILRGGAQVQPSATDNPANAARVSTDTQIGAPAFAQGDAPTI